MAQKDYKSDLQKLGKANLDEVRVKATNDA